MASLLDRARAFLEADVDAADRTELTALVAAAESGDARAALELGDRFQGPLEFGTAGLRGLIGAGETRMNRAVVIRATAGLVRHVLQAIPNAAERGIVIGRDARRFSEAFADDAAAVCAAAGVRVHFLPGTSPTPLVAFAVSHLEAAAGIMVTASHNPPAYNGYKVYWDNGAQIIPPVDKAIAGHIAAAPGARDVPRIELAAARDRGLVRDVPQVEEAYLVGLARLAFDPSAPMAELSVAYSALHGVGDRLFGVAMRRRGVTKLFSVPEQAQPDGRFPTLEFPNPEEPGALDLVLALAERQRADLVLVNDPDADRLGAAVRCPKRNQFVVLSGNEIGALLADHVITHDLEGGDRRLVVSTIVSSQLLRRMARDRNVHCAETLTGFKWIANEALRIEREEGWRFAFGYEEALGYTVGTVVRDKDGIGAGLVLAEMAAGLKSAGLTLLDRLEAIRRAHGFFVNRQKSLTLPGRDGAARIRDAMASLRAAPPSRLAGVAVDSVWDLGAGTRTEADGTVTEDPRFFGDVLVYELADGGRVSVRPSGTEPKIKLYLEVVETLGQEPADAALARGEARLDGVQAEMLERAGLG